MQAVSAFSTTVKADTKCRYNSRMQVISCCCLEYEQMLQMLQMQMLCISFTDHVSMTIYLMSICALTVHGSEYHMKATRCAYTGTYLSGANPL